MAISKSNVIYGNRQQKERSIKNMRFMTGLTIVPPLIGAFISLGCSRLLTLDRANVY